MGKGILQDELPIIHGRKYYFLTSDEELEDSKALLYLPIAPEVEDPEENPYGPPPDAVQTAIPDDGIGSEKKRQSLSDGPQPPKKKPKTTNIELQGVPNDGEWELPSFCSCCYHVTFLQTEEWAKVSV